jgi:type IV pilus assembly protein PilO
MTFSEDFAPIEGDQDLELEPSYPVAFGIELTPKVQGIALALLGVGGHFFYING